MKLLNQRLAEGLFVLSLGCIAYTGLKLYRPQYELLYCFAKKREL